MKSRRKLMLTAAAVSVLAIPRAALAQSDLNCAGTTITGGTYHNVTAYFGCNLISVTVTGNVTVVPGGGLYDFSSTIAGNLQANNALYIAVFGSTSTAGTAGRIGGNLQVTGTTSSPGEVPNYLCGTTVGGDVQVQSSSYAAPFDIGDCSGEGPLVIGGNLTVQNNAAYIDMGPSDVTATNPFCTTISSTGNSACGNIEVHNNTGGGILQDNSALGNCQLYNDVPAFSVGGNTAGKTNDCNTPN